jgi:hypothetical protein
MNTAKTIRPMSEFYVALFDGDWSESDIAAGKLIDLYYTICLNLESNGLLVDRPKLSERLQDYGVFFHANDIAEKSTQWVDQKMHDWFWEYVETGKYNQAAFRPKKSKWEA